MLMTALTAVLALLLVATPAADGPFMQRANQQSQEELLQAYTQTAVPGEAHERLAGLEGSWKQSIKLWMQRGQEPVLTEGACKNEMILGGRYLASECWGGEGDLYMESLVVTGFDRRWNHYTVVGYDTMGTYYVTAAGDYDPGTRTITMYGEDEDPVLGHTQRYDIVMRFVDDDTYVSEVIFKDRAHTGGEGPFKMVEITFTRVIE